MNKVKSFKEFINESVWGDLRKRSSGEVTRREDDVMNMDMESFWLYLIKNYKERVMTLDKDHYCKDYDMDIVVDPTNDVVIFGSYVKDELVRIMIVLKTKANDTTVKKIIDTSPDNFRWIRINSDKLELELNNGDVTNQTFVDLIEFFLNNQQVFESIWSDLQDRSSGDVIRKEDEIVSNIKELKPVDMGCSVLWADRDLESDENVYFSFTDAEKIIKNSGWRLPTFNEVVELNKNVIIYKNTLEEYRLRYYKTHGDLIFEKCGYQYADEDRVLDCDSYYAWTSDTAKSGSEAYQTIFIRNHIAAVPMHYMNRCCVRLVKDK